jgi:hypothetical protein
MNQDQLDKALADAFQEGRMQLQDEVVNYWQRMDGWIPGAVWREFAEVLGVKPERLITSRRAAIRERQHLRQQAHSRPEQPVEDPDAR